MKKIIAILIAVVVVSSMSVIAIHAVSSDNIELPEADTTVAEATEATETVPVTTEAVVTEPEQTEPVETEPEVTEAEVTEPEPEIPEEIRGILGTFNWKTEAVVSKLKENPDWFFKNIQYDPAITFNADKTLAFRVYYIGGASTVYGTYDVVGNKINIKLDLENSFFKGGYKCPCKDHTGNLHPFMSDEMVFEIVDNDNIIVADDGKYGCYTLTIGDSFVRGEWWLNEEAE